MSSRDEPDAASGPGLQHPSARFTRLRRRLSAGCAALLILSSLACQTTPVPPPDAGVPISADDAQVRTSLRELHANAAALTSLRGSAKLSIDSPQIRLSRPQRVVLQKPASLRIEVLGLFDQVMALVVTDGESFGFIDLLSGTRDSGPVDDGVLWRTARVDLTPSEAVSLLLGVPPVDPAARVVRAVRFGDGAVGALVRGGGVSHWLEWDRAGGLRRAELRSPDGVVEWVARFGDRSDVTAISFAHSVELEFPRMQAIAKFEYYAVELQPELSPALFVLQVAPGE